MTEPQKTSHWNSLAETLGAKVPPEPAPGVEPASAPAAVPPVAAAPVRRAAAEKPKPAPRKSNWGEVASVLGLAPPPEPPPAPVTAPPVAARPAPPEPVAERPARREPHRESPRAESSEDRRRADEARDASRTRYDERREEARSRPPEPAAREWDAPNEDDSAVMSDDLEGLVDESSVEETEIDLELVEDASDSDVEAADDAALREEGERRPKRRRRRRGRRQRRPEEGEARAPRAEPGAESLGESTDLSVVKSGDEPTSEGPRGERRPAAEGDERPRRRKRRRGRGRTGKERPPPRRPAPDESARDEEAAFITETGGGDELDADFGPDDELEPGHAEEIRAERPARHEAAQGEEEEHDEDDLGDDGEHVGGKKHKVPSWQETIGLIVDANLANRGKSSPHPQRGGRGRGRGRGR